MDSDVNSVIQIRYASRPELKFKLSINGLGNTELDNGTIHYITARSL